MGSWTAGPPQRLRHGRAEGIGLHDGPIQSVAALAMRAHLANRQLASDPVGAAKEVQELEALARRTTQDLRYLHQVLQGCPRPCRTWCAIWAICTAPKCS